MTSTPVSNLAQAQPTPVLVSKTGKLWIGIIGLLMIGFHWDLIRMMARIGYNDPNWSHVLIIPLISIYYIQLHRAQIMATPRRVCRWGLPFIVAGIIGYLMGVYVLKNVMAMGYSMVLTLFGVTLLLLGPAMMRILWFPIAFMFFAIKISPAIWTVITGKMQGFASYGAYAFIHLSKGITGMDAELRGSTIDLLYRSGGEDIVKPLNVAEACAGMRMLMAFMALGVALAFLFPRRWWQRAIMVLMAAPIAIFVNALRVAILGWLHLIDPAYAQGDFHVFVGMLTLIPAAGLLMLVGWCLEKAVITEGRPKAGPAPLPFGNDPMQVHFDTPRILRGAGIGGATVLMLGLSFVFLINLKSGGEVIGWLSGGLNTALMGAAGVLFFIGLVLAWRSIRQSDTGGTGGNRDGRHALSSGVAGGMLLVALLGQTTAANVMGLALTKKALPLRHGIALEFPNRGGDWELLHQDPKQPKDIEDELGTKEYFNRYYVNNDAGIYAEDIEVKTMETPLGERLAGWDVPIAPGQIAKVHITYYTGMLDAVPHVPDKCWVVAGNKQVYRKIHTLDLSRYDYEPDPTDPTGQRVLARSTGFDEKVRLPTDKVEAVIFGGEDEEGRSSYAMYFFLANGNAVASNHAVRFSFNLKDRYSYYCKVEVMFPGVNNPAEIEAYGEDLLSDLLPEVMACLPDWTEVQAGNYPEKPETAGE